MLTYNKYLFTSWHAGARVDQKGDTGLGNILYFIAGTIGIAVKNGYEYGFVPNCASDYFVNPLPGYDDSLTEEITIPWGFHGFDYPDNKIITGQLQSPKYFEHCMDLIKHYFTLKDVADPLKDTIVMHYRNYTHPYFVNLKRKYYIEALRRLPKKRVVVLTDDIPAARAAIGDEFEYQSNTPIIDFYLGVNADYLVIANSSFSCWWAYLSNAKKIFAPFKWYTKELDQSPAEIYHKSWIKI